MGEYRGAAMRVQGETILLTMLGFLAPSAPTKPDLHTFSSVGSVEIGVILAYLLYDTIRLIVWITLFC